MRILHILCFLVGVQLIINGVFFSSSLLTATGAALICLFILLATKRSARDHSNHGNGNGHTAHHGDIGPKYHQIASGRETYFAPIALLSLIGGCLAYLFLPIDNVYEKTAITVTGTGLLYILLVLFIHGRRATRRNNVLTLLFGGLLLLGAGASVALWRGPISTHATNIASIIHSNVKSRFVVQTISDDNTDENMLSGNMATNTSGATVTTTGATMTEDDNQSSGNTSTTTESTSGKNRDVAMTFGELIPYIVHKYGLTADNRADVAFTNLSKSDGRYKAFKAAYYDRFIGRTVDPEKQVKCDNYVVFLGLAENRPVSYTAENVYTVFREEGTKRGALGGCKPGAYVKRTNLY